MQKLTTNNIVNLILFQGVWFFTVIGAANGSLLPGLISLAIFFVVHSFLSATVSADFLLAACAVVIGLAVETVLVQTGLLIYPIETLSVVIVPLWILILWANFALIMNGCISWLHGRYFLAAVLGFMGGPLSYFGGINLGAASAGGSLVMLLLAVAMTYAMVTPLLLFLAQHLVRFRSV